MINSCLHDPLRSGVRKLVGGFMATVTDPRASSEAMQVQVLSALLLLLALLWWQQVPRSPPHVASYLCHLPCSSLGVPPAYLYADSAPSLVTGWKVNIKKRKGKAH